ncbi:hypothetical protein AB0F88_39855 [Streptosporangium sp. NPDC023963]|uniref:hypothetical protein n=1 Tax=Streptosporangium sp. NPDC023963 TaxID=3155608 RepID=UPI00342A5296
MIHELPESAAARLQARADALREDRPGYTDPLVDVLWRECRHAEDHGFIYDDPRAIAVIALEHIAGDLAQGGARQASAGVEGVEG